MRGLLTRIWIVALAFCVGSAWGQGRPPLPFLPIAATGALLLCLRRPAAARIPGLVMVAVALGAVGASARSSEEPAIARLAAVVPQCDVSGTVLEHAGGLGTLVAVERAVCTGFSPVDDPGSVWVDGSLGYSGSPVTGR